VDLNDLTELSDLDRRALAGTGRLVAAVRPGQLASPTPCDGWDVRTLVNHVIGGNHLYAEAATGRTADWGTREDDRLGDDPVAAYQGSARAVTAAFAGLDLVADRLVMPFGELPASQAVAVHFVDVLTHGWDLATATGQDPTLDPELATAALDIVAGYPPEAWGTPQFFAHQVPVPDSSPPHIRLVALLGRHP
jgi:uncharacterized protein (TIGR03086 family)